MKARTVIATHETKIGQSGEDDEVIQAEKLGVSSRNPEDLSKKLLAKSQTMKGSSQGQGNQKLKSTKKDNTDEPNNETDYGRWVIAAAAVVAIGFFVVKKIKS